MARKQVLSCTRLVVQSHLLLLCKVFLTHDQAQMPAGQPFYTHCSCLQDRKLLIIGTTSTHSVLQQMGLADSFSYQTHVPYLSNGGQVMAVLKVHVTCCIRALLHTLNVHVKS